MGSDALILDHVRRNMFHFATAPDACLSPMRASDKNCIVISRSPIKVQCHIKGVPVLPTGTT